MNYLNYRFFDYKHNIPNFDSDLFKTEHIIFIILAFISIISICIFIKKVNKRKVDKYIKIMSIVITILEITKIVWESYYDIRTGRGFNKEGILPLYTCSLYIYCMLLAGWTKGKAKEYSLSFLTTIGLLFGGIGLVYCNGLNWYPFWTFGAFYSLFFHYIMLFTGVFLLSTKYKKLEWVDANKSFIVICCLALISIPANYEYGADYMQLYSASGVLVMSNISTQLANKGYRFIFTTIMLLLYIPLSFLVIGGYKLLRKIKK